MHCRLLQQVHSDEEGHGLSADDLIISAKVVFAKFRPPKKIVSDACTNFLSD